METQEIRTTRPLYIEVPAEVRLRLKRMAAEEDTTIAALVRRALERCYGVAA